MRDSNYKSIPLNKAAVTITTNLYDRRALDATCDRPLVNSLNHLTFLTSSSAKVRETLATDGGLERLVCILHDCHKDQSHSMPRDKSGRKTIAEEKHDALVAWKWTLAFQCLVLIGTRGTEKIRERVVQAGVVPIIATVLDNFLLASKNFDASTDGSLGESFVSLVQNQIQSQVLKEKKAAVNVNVNRRDHLSTQDSDMFSDDEDQSALIANYLSADSELLRYLTEINSNSNGYNTNNNSSIADSGSATPEFINDTIPSITELNIQQNLHDINHTITSPRFFLRGVLIPKEDDVVWSLQLLAFISKYSCLKKHLQSTHLIDYLSLRALLQGGGASSGSQHLNAPGLETDDNDNDAEMELISNLSSDESEQTSNHIHHSQHLSASQRLIHSQGSQPSSQLLPQTQPNPSPSSTAATTASSSAGGVHIQVNNNSNEELNQQQEGGVSTTGAGAGGKSAELPDLNANLIAQTSLKPKPMADSKNKCCLSKSLLQSLMKFETCSKGQGREEKTFSFIELTTKLNSFYADHCLNSKIRKIKNSRAEREAYQEKWNYESHSQLHPQDANVDSSSIAKNGVNVFPLVEKFTVKGHNTTDMCYWSGVIMRNSCRKAESGVRQCACFDCGRWEQFPRQFAKCRRCKRTKYCSKECQLRAWGYHKHWCVDSASTTSSSQGQSVANQQESQPATRDEIRLPEGL